MLNLDLDLYDLFKNTPELNFSDVVNDILRERFPSTETTKKEKLQLEANEAQTKLIQKEAQIAEINCRLEGIKNLKESLTPQELRFMYIACIRIYVKNFPTPAIIAANYQGLCSSFKDIPQKLSQAQFKQLTEILLPEVKELLNAQQKHGCGDLYNVFID
jgi:predicted phage-related endonuclease